VDRHRRWEKENKPRILEYQNIQRRLNADGDDRESASIENFRPTTSTMNMDGALIPGTQYYLPPVGVDPIVPFSTTTSRCSPARARRRAEARALTNAQRAELKAAISKLREQEEEAA
jgi:hypothetical protein